MIDKIKEKLRGNSYWWGLLTAYILSFTLVYGLIWAAIEPMSIPDNFQSLPKVVSSRFFWHIFASLLISCNLTLIVFAIYRFRKPSNDRLYQVEEVFGFVFRNVIDKRIVNIDGSWSFTFSYTIEATSADLEQIPHPMSLLGGVGFGESSINVSGTSPYVRVHHDIVTQSKQLIFLLVRFTPALKKGQKADVTIEGNMGSGFTMSLEEVTDQINKGVWPYTTPYEFTTLDIKYPTSQVTFRVTFPPKYKIYGTDYFDILFPSSFQRINGVFNKFKNTGKFNHYNHNDQIVLELTDAVIVPGIRYCLKWLPPRRNEYLELFPAGNLPDAKGDSPDSVEPTIEEDSKPDSEQKRRVAFPESTVFFYERFCSAFPGVRGIEWFTAPGEAITRLSKLLEQPLGLTSDANSGTFNPIWWWRGGNLHIYKFEQIDNDTVLLNNQELKISKIAAVNPDTYYRCFVYVETKPMEPTGLYPRTEEEIEQSVNIFGYCSEEYGLFKDKFKVSRAEYEDGAAKINGSIVELQGEAKLRVRHITPYNMIIAAFNSPLNNSRFDQDLKQLMNDMLTEKVSLELVEEMISQLPKREPRG